ncbi:hypothetical protein K9M48_04015 [Candidatus Gracilibacteria bacterium]|nr:hypothetical protein [Candidatus Gracilibacteria bacterium]
MNPRNHKFKRFISKTFHKFDRYGKNQRLFILYLIVLAFCLVFFPIVSVTSSGAIEGYSVRLISGYYFKSMLIIFLSLAALILRNSSFRFKNFVITYLGFKENNYLVNFGLLRVITTAFFGITDTINVIDWIKSVNTTGTAKFVQILLLLGLIFTLVSVVKGAKQNSSKTKIVNIVDENVIKENQNKRVFKGLFDEESKDD